MNYKKHIEQLTARAHTLKIDTYALYLALQAPETPWYAKAVAGLTVAMALSPIDLIPDFIPILGYLDDLLLIPLGITLAVKLTPPATMARCRQQARLELGRSKGLARLGVLIVSSVWLSVIALTLWLALRSN